MTVDGIVEARPSGAAPPAPMRVVEFLRFLAAGGVAALANLISRWAFNFVMPFELAVVLAYIVGMAIAFYLFQRLIFADPGTPMRRRMIRFVQVNLVGMALAWMLSVVLARSLLPMIGWTFLPLETAHSIGVAAPAISSYFGHKFYTWR